MSEARSKELAELLPVHVLRLANAQIGLNLMDWGEISSDIMEAARLLAALSAEPVGDAEIEAIRERSLAWQQSYECNDPTKQAQIDRATLLRKVDELTRAEKET